MTTDHYSQALDHVHAVREARESLREIYREDYRDPRAVAQLNADLGDALKLAEVHATLAVVDALDNIAERLAPGAPSPAPGSDLEQLEHDRIVGALR